MRRALLAIVAAALGLLAVTLTGPEPVPPPDFGTIDITDNEGAAASPSAWYCPWVEAGDVVDSDVIVASEPSVTFDLTLLHPVANEAPASTSLELAGPGATAVATGDVLRVGESPAIVELSDGPAAAASVSYAGAFIAADRCVVSVPKIWYLTGGSTRTGTITQLRLFNPFADNAEVSITAYSEFDLDLVQELQDYDVAGRSWATIDLEPYLPFRDHMTFTITSNKGLVIPALIRSDDRGEAMWPGTAPSDTWNFPIVTVGELEPFISVMSAGDDDIIVTVDIVGEAGMIRNAREVVLSASTPELIPLSDLAAAPYGVRLRATSPIAASVIAVVPQPDPEGGEGSLETTTTTEAGGEVPEEAFIKGMAGTVGAPQPNSEWIVPVATFPGSETTVWVMNTGTDAAVVEWEALGETEYPVGGSVEVPPESTLGIPIEVGIGVYGVSVSSSLPVSVAWGLAGDQGVALSAGVALN